MRTQDRYVERERREKAALRKRRERFMRCLVVAFLCVGITVQAVLAVRLVIGKDKVDQLKQTIDQLKSDETNYEVVIESNEDRNALKQRALNSLGMVEPDTEHIRVVHLPINTDSDSQLVMNDPAND